MGKTTEYVVCFNCYRNQILNKKEKGLVNFNRWNPETSDFIQVREGLGRTKEGKSQGFPKVDTLTLHDAVLSGNSEYKQVIKQEKEQLLKVVQAFYDEGIITKTELNSIK